MAVSTASVWVRDIELPEQARAALEAADPVRNRRRTGQLAWSRMARDARMRAQVHGRELAAAGDPLHVAGCMLYWAEGSKKRNNLTFTNSDAEMMRLFVRFLRECYDLGDHQMTLSVNCHLGNGLSVEEIEAWWLDRLELPATSLRAAAVNRVSSSSKGVRRPLVYGTARLVVYSTSVLQSIYGAIQEYAGMTRPEWAEIGLTSAESYAVGSSSGQ